MPTHFSVPDTVEVREKVTVVVVADYPAHAFGWFASAQFGP